MNNSYCENCQNYIDLDNEPEHEEICRERDFNSWSTKILKKIDKLKKKND